MRLGGTWHLLTDRLQDPQCTRSHSPHGPVVVRTGSSLIDVILNVTTSIERQTTQKAINTPKRQQDTEEQLLQKNMRRTHLL